MPIGVESLRTERILSHFKHFVLISTK